MERTSILKYIENNIERNGKLRENFTLEPYKKINPKGINFIDGAEDGMMLFHMKVEPQKEEILYITNLIKKASKDNIEETCIKLDEYFANNKIKTLPNMDLIIDDIRKNSKNVDPNALLDLAVRIIANTRNIELMKLGICLIGMIDVSRNKGLVEVLEKIALSDEFSLYINYVIRNWKNANEIRFMLAKKLDGWGKIHLVTSLEPTTENIKEWLITEGCKNKIHLGYLANIVAKKIDIIDVLHRNKLNKKQLEGIDYIMQGLLEKGPVSGIERFSDSTELFESYIEQFKKVMDDINFYHIPVMISRYLAYKKERTEEEDYIFLKIGDLIECEKAVQTLKKAILSGETKKFIQAIEVATIDSNIPVEEDIYKVYSEDPFNRFDAFPYLVSAPKYAKNTIYLMEHSQNFKENYKQPEPILWSSDNYATNLTYIIQILSHYPFTCNNIIVAGLKSKTIHPRNAAINTIIEWQNKSKKDIKDFPKEIYIALQELQKTEMVKVCKERINKILKIEEDLSNYKEPPVIFREPSTKPLNIDLYSEEIEKLFEPQIIFRGTDYFENNMIYSCIQKENKYIGYIQGTEFGKEYEVEIEINGNTIKSMKCNCPYTGNCKHEYAMILYLRKENTCLN